MTSTPVILLTRRSGNSSDRPFPQTVAVGELAINFAGDDNGLYFQDSANNVRKVSGIHYGNTAPNSAPQGQPGNSVGEAWSDSSSAANYLYVWTGASWQKQGAGFADQADNANTANFALAANNATNADFAQVAGTVLSGTVDAVADVFTGAFPPATPVGSLAYKNDVPSGLYVAVNGGWVPA